MTLEAKARKGTVETTVYLRFVVDFLERETEGIDA